MIQNKFEPYYYGNTTKREKNKTDKFIEANKDKKMWSLSLYFDATRLVKRQKSKSMFWEGHRNDFSLCKTSDLSKFNGVYTFEEALKLFKEFPLQNYELIRLNFDTERYWGNHDVSSLEHFILIRDLEKEGNQKC